MRVLSRRGMTVRRSLDILSKQLENIQKERNELKNTLFQREREISDLLRFVIMLSINSCVLVGYSDTIIINYV